MYNIVMGEPRTVLVPDVYYLVTSHEKAISIVLFLIMYINMRATTKIYM